MQVILKATTACNGSCRYCAAAPGDGGAASLSAGRLGALFEVFRPWLEENAARRLGFLWHGGEPMLRGLTFYERAATEQARVFGEHLPQVSNRLQSNLTQLTEAWIPFLQSFVRSIGTSYDPLPGVRGLADGSELSRTWLRAVAMCRAAGISVGVVYVVHGRSLGHARDLYRFFRNLDGRGRMRFNPLYPEGRAAEACADLAITPDDYGRFLVEVAQAWWDDGRRADVRPLTDWVRAWRDPAARRTCDSASACHEDMLGVGPRGDAWICGRFADRGVETWRLGNVFEDDLDTILAHPARAGLAERAEQLRRDGHPCHSCTYWNVCRAGCPSMAALVHADPMRETPFCEARRRVFAFLEERLGAPTGDDTPSPASSAEAAP